MWIAYLAGAVSAISLGTRGIIGHMRFVQGFSWSFRMNPGRSACASVIGGAHQSICSKGGTRGSRSFSHSQILPSQARSAASGFDKHSSMFSAFKHVDSILVEGPGVQASCCRVFIFAEWYSCAATFELVYEFQGDNQY
mmetsp:Transcript_50098/g.131963  ORF Transcript_50098/g.131963 Transcript_50098/m.131963 type:complete len:139 (+) Transcript_50098:321-737(+)